MPRSFNQMVRHLTLGGHPLSLHKISFVDPGEQVAVERSREVYERHRVGLRLQQVEDFVVTPTSNPLAAGSAVVVQKGEREPAGFPKQAHDRWFDALRLFEMLDDLVHRDRVSVPGDLVERAADVETR